MTFTDKAGLSVAPGDLIVYGHALGRCASLQYGKALAVLESGRLRVCGVDEQRWPGGKRLTQMRPGTLQYGYRTLKVERCQVPADALAVLDSITVPK